MHEYTTMCFSIHILMNIRVVSTFSIINKASIGMCKSLKEYMNFSWVNHRDGMTEHMLDFLRNWQPVSESVHNILHCHQQCIRVQVVPHSPQHLVLSVFLISVYTGIFLMKSPKDAAHFLSIYYIYCRIYYYIS